MSNWLAYAIGLAVKSTVVLSLAWLATAAMRKRSAAARHVVWTAAFTAILVIPLLGLITPSLRAPGLSRVLPTAANPIFRVNAAIPTDAAIPVASVRAPQPSKVKYARFTPDWPWIALCLWSAGAALMLLQMLFACLRMIRQRRASAAFTAVHEDIDLPAGVRVLKAAAASMPMAFGLRKPVVFMPADALLWDPERRRMVLQHECAHIERGDLATHFLARTALSLLWWHPLAWNAWSEFLKERERAADDLVLRTGARASAYASHLLDIARSASGGRSLACASVAMARPAQLEGRLLAILDSAANHSAPRRAALFASAALAAAFVLPLAALQPQDPALPADVEATIRTALTQKNHEILDQAATAFLQKRDYDTARKLDDASLQIRESQSGAASASYAQGLVKIAQLEMARKNRSEAVKFYEKAVSLGDRPEVVHALIALGTDALVRKDAAAATDYYQRALNVAQSPEDQSHIFLMLANADQLDPNTAAQAVTHYQSAITAAPRESNAHIAAQMVYAKYLEKQGNADQAKTVMDQVDAELKTANARLRTAASPAPNSSVYRVGNGVSQPVPVYHPEPEYTEDARAAKYQGSVVLYIEVGADGRVYNPKVIKTLGLGLDEKAIEAVSQWTFKPGSLNGQPVAVQANVEVNFRLL